MNVLIERYYGLHTLFYRALKIDDRYCNVTPLFATLSQYATCIVMQHHFPVTVMSAGNKTTIHFVL